MDMLKYILLTVVTCLSLWGCYDDKGNYDYHDLDEIVIDSTGAGILANYSVNRLDVLDIPIKVYFKGKLVNGSEYLYPELECNWVVYQQGTDVPIAGRDTIAEGIELSLPLNLDARQWELVFTVLNKETGVRAFMKFGLKVNAGLSEGWMVLYERDGKTDVGILANKRIAPNVVNEQVWVDVFETFTGASLEGEPVRLLYSKVTKPEVVMAVTKKDMVAVDPLSFTKLYSFDALFWTAPEVKAPRYYTAFYNKREMVINDGKVHTANYTTSGSDRSSIHFGAPCYGGYGRLANWSPTTSSYSAVLYDEVQQCFKCVKANSSEVSDFPAQDAAVAFDCKNVGLELVASDYGRAIMSSGFVMGHYEDIVMRDATGHYYLLIADFSSQTMVGVGKYDMGRCEGLSDGIVSVAAGYKGEIFYYATGNGLYLYDYKGTNTTGDGPVWNVPTGEQITCIRLQKYCYGTTMMAPIPVNDCEVLYVATYNEKEGNGTVYQFMVDPSSGAVDKGSLLSFSGFGKIKDMGWKIE